PERPALASSQAASTRSRVGVGETRGGGGDESSATAACSAIPASSERPAASAPPGGAGPRPVSLTRPLYTMPAPVRSRTVHRCQAFTAPRVSGGRSTQTRMVRKHSRPARRFDGRLCSGAVWFHFVAGEQFAQRPRRWGRKIDAGHGGKPLFEPEIECILGLSELPK